MKTLYGLFLLDILLGQFHVEASFGKSYKNYFGGPLQNLQLLDDKLFIGCRNNISVVDRHLNLINVSSTCNISGCENDNKILIAFKEGNASKLLVCGTGNNGLCELRDANDLSNIKLTSPLQISTNIKRPAVALIDNNSGNLTIAVTYGEGIEEKVDSLGLFFTYDYAISTRKLSSPFNLEGDTDTEVKKLALKFYKSEYTPKNYIIYYRSGFQFNNYIYFLTNQKEYVGSPISVSKLARICQNGTAYKTYADIILECVDKETGDTYNLLQNAIIIDAPSNRREKLLVASFTKGDDFENPSGNSVICTGILSDIDRKVVDAKKDYALHYCGENFEREELRRYIIQTRTSECVLNSTEALESDINCGDRIPQITNVIGNKTVYFTLSSKLRLPSSEGQISFLHGSKDVNRNVTLAAGTSNGQIFRMVINNNLDMLMYDKFTVDAGFPIRGIYQSNNDNGDDGEDGDVLFVLSSNKR